MARSISIVEYKVEQTRFFLEQIEGAEDNFFAAQCFTDAFASACRTVTFSMQAVCGEVDGFKEWYAGKAEELKKDELSKFFNAYRVASIHVGDTVVRGGSSFRDEGGKRRRKYFFMPTQDLPEVPQEDVLSVCRAHFVNLLNVVYGAFTAFLCQLDDRWYFTAEHFAQMGKSVEEAAVELGFPGEWITAASGLTDVQKWRTLRSAQTVGCQLNGIFHDYLGKTIAGPEEEQDVLVYRGYR